MSEDAQDQLKLHICYLNVKKRASTACFTLA